MSAAADKVRYLDALREKERRLRIADRWWRLTNLYKITDEHGREIQFSPNAAQRKLLDELHTLNAILKARQLGFSTFIQILMLDACLFAPNIRAGVIAHSMDDAEVLFRDKIKFAYDRLPDWLRAKVKATTDRVGEMVFSNGSSIRVSTSMRSGTLQFLHVSELGKIGRKYPEKDQEIKTGSLPTVHEGGHVFFESTAEGKSGLFYETVQAALKRAQAGRQPHRMEFKLHFYPWHEDNRYRTDPAGVTLTAEEIAYFRDLAEKHGIRLDAEQQAWWALRSRVLGDKMGQEYPSTVDEAFAVAIEGAILGKEMARVRADRRICAVPHASGIEVNTFWDLGRNDATFVWFHQRVGAADRFIRCYRNNFESLAHYAAKLKELAEEHGYIYGKHYLPHDVEVTDLSTGDQRSRREILEGLGVRPIVVVERIADLREGIDMMRRALGSCLFDETECADGVWSLDEYRREWDDKVGAYRDHPARGPQNHGADAFRQFAQGYRAPVIERRERRKERRINWRTV